MDDLAFLDLWLHHSNFHQLLHITFVCGGVYLCKLPLPLSYKNTLHLEHTQISQDSEVVELLVTQLCPTLSEPMDCSLPGSSVPGIFQARVLQWGAIAFSLRANIICYPLSKLHLVSLENGVSFTLCSKNTDQCLSLSNAHNTKATYMTHSSYS